MRKILDCNCSARLGSLAPFVLRVATGAIFAMHGWQKFQGGIPQVAGFLGSLGFPMPELFAFFLIAAELVGGIFLILGLYTHWSAKILAVVSLVALVTVHMGKGFFVSDGGYEFIMLLLAATISLAITGPGRWTLRSIVGKK
jgi:putative oxidoreductase